jgi:hypothetical protein
MFAAAQLHVEGHWHAPLVVEGAEVQRGRGNATRRSDGSKVLIAGTEAAHFGYGTVKRQGSALSVSAARQAVIWQRTSGYAEGDPRGSFGANGALAGIGLEADASTFLEPGFMNQSDGLLERQKQSMLNLITPRIVLATPEQLECYLLSNGMQVAERLLGDKEAVISPLEDRLGTLARNPGEGRFVLDPTDADARNKLFGGSEQGYLEVVRDLHRNPQGGLARMIEEFIKTLPALSHSFAELADEARAERVESPTFEPTPPSEGA